MRIGLPKLGGLGTQFQHGFQSPACRQPLRGPRLELGELRGKSFRIRGPIRVPHAGLEFPVEIGEALATVTNLEKGVQTTQNQAHRRKECPPSGLRRGPPVRIDRVGRVLRLDILSFSFEMAVGGGEGGLICGQGQGHSQDTLLPDRSRNIRLVAIKMRMFLIG